MGNASSEVSEDKSILRYLDDDVLRYVCEKLHELVLYNKTLPMYDRPEVSMLSLSLTCRRLRALCKPYIFQVFRLECYGKNPWWEASNRLKTWNPNLSPHIREISISLCMMTMYNDSFLANWFVSSLPDNLAHALHHLSLKSPHLDKISVRIADEKYHLFHAAFTKIGLAFPDIRRLALSPTHGSMMDLCPNVRSLSIHGESHLDINKWSRKVFERAKGLPKLEGVLVVAWDRPELFEAMLTNIPRIRVLVIQFHTLFTCISFENFVTYLARFTEVEILVVPPAAALNIGYDPPGCGNVYFGPGGEDYRRQVEREGREAERRAAKAILERCPQVKELWFDTYSKVTRAAAFGQVEVVSCECTWSKRF